MITQPSSHLHAEFQHHSAHRFFNVQSVSLQEWGSISEGEWEEETGFSKNKKSEPSPGTGHLKLPNKE